ncbi:hypothetical protein T11_4867 [Trichinella zimbabwensis]|uniref:Uncharacterized protein n=1 Tax=Trichinella zimbabwensis TaxID=268475 RepID=A0A0V1GK37_9BILA|nr:hypothetical protein T11_4867 [Trichinella zimbabwensis]
MSTIDKHLEGATSSMVATGSVAAATTEIPNCGQRWRDNASALQWALPGRWSTLKSYSASCSSQRATCPSGSLKLRNQCRQLWSVRTSNC